MTAYFTNGESVGDRPTLVRLGEEVGLDAAEVGQILDTDAYADDVRTEESTARSLGISGVPFFVIDRAYGVSGAQSPDLLLEVLEKAWAASHPLTMVTDITDEACADGSCAV